MGQEGGGPQINPFVAFGLRITSRCWHDDLGYKTPEAPIPLLAFDQVIVRDFLMTRMQMPDGHEGPIASLGVPHMKLKASRWRGVTIWEKQPRGKDIQDPSLSFPGVVWLLAVGYRSAGDADDAYRDFERLGVERLAPRPIDYEYLYSDIHEAVLDATRRELERVANELLELAWREPGVFHRADIEIADIALGITLFDNAEYRVLVLPVVDSRNRAIPEEVHTLLVRTIFDCRLDELEFAPDPAVLAEMGYQPRPSDMLVAQLRERRR